MLAILPLGMLGPGQIVLIVVLVVVLFGGKKIPELMRGVGRGMKEFKDAMNKDYTNDDDFLAPPKKRINPGESA